jgi:outer membrane receptor for ferrienterochelin and colicins
VNVNYVKQYRWNKISLNVDASAWYSYFINQIIADYDTDPNKIIYENLDGNAVSRGFTMNLEFNAGHRFKSLVGFTLQQVTKNTIDDQGKKISQLPVLTEKWSGTWALTYTFPAIRFTIDYTGNIYGPMRLPLLSATDPRPGYSPVWSIQNIQFTKSAGRKFEFFGGIKNLLSWTPARNTPFIIARSHDPFDKKVEYNTNGSVKATAENPYALSFDPSYVYAPNQGLRVFAGIRFTVKE